MYNSNERRGAWLGRALLTFLVAYAVAVFILGLADAASLVRRTTHDSGLSTIELGLLAIFSLRLSPTVHVALLASGAILLAIVASIPPRFSRTRVGLLCAPLGLLASVTARAAVQLPLIKRLPLLETGTWIAAFAAPIALIGIGLFLARDQVHPWLKRGAIAVLAIGLAVFIRVFGLTEAVMARIPGTLLSLVALTYLIGYLLRNVRHSARIAVALVAMLAVASAYVALMPNARTVRADAIIAHKTQLLQALLFTELGAFERALELPPCEVPLEPSPPANATRRHNVLVITLDALRSDRLAAYGYDRVTMPHTEALLRESVVFDTAYSAAPATAGSLTALWTGSSAYTMRARGSWPATLHERMRELGYRVLGTDLSVVARSTAPGFPKRPLWDAPIPPNQRATAIVDALIQQIATTQTAFLAFVHFNETHDERRYQYVPRVFPERAMSRYDDGMFEVDRHIGRLLEALRATGRYDDTVIAFTSDHGEFFGEHTRMHHGSLLYEPVVRVPFALRLPGVAPRREPTFASGFDLAPTVYKAATGRPWPVLTLGRDVFAEIEGGRRDRAVYMENVSGQRGVRRVVAVRKGRYKYTLLRGTGIEELFDLERDPDELDNRAGEAPEQMRALRRELEAALHAQACELRSSHETLAARR